MNFDKTKIIQEWDDLIAINKSEGSLTIPGRGNKENIPVLSHQVGEYLRGGAKQNNNKPDLFVVHRLDQGTSGAILFAKNAETHKSLNTQFENGEVKKKYWCLVQGVPETQTIDAKIFKLPSKKNKSIVDHKGKDSQTKITILASSEGFSLVEAEPVTGRTHQIRVHLAHIKTPILGDTLYGGPKLVNQKEIPYTLLHCRSLKFKHKNVPTEVVAEPSELLKKWLEHFGWTRTTCL